MSFSVSKIEARIVDHAVRADGAIVSFLGRHCTSRYVTVTLRSSSGAAGFGEATTAMIWSGESAETAKWMIENVLAPIVVGAHFDHPSEAVAVMDAQLHANPFAKAAMDTALWDLWARSQDVSVSRLIADREPLGWVPTRASIGAYPPEQTVRLAVEFWEAGVRTLKFKTGVPGIDDVARLRAVRERLGSEPVFTIDANGAHATADEAVRAIDALLPFNLALVEQPTRRGRISVLADVRRRTTVPLMADEAVFTRDELEEALDLDAIDVLSVYPGKNGGFTHALAMAKRAQQAGKACAIGSNLETDLGQAPHVCLAASISAFDVDRFACDLMGSLFYAKSSVSPALVFDRGRVALQEGPGFGVTPND